MPVLYINDQLAFLQQRFTRQQVEQKMAELDTQ